MHATTSDPLHRPRVSVIVPAYNRGEFIGETLRSVLDQTLPVHEVLVIDNGSTDDTVAVVQRFCADQNSGSQVKLLHQPLQGVSAARNMGLEAATGDWIAFLDSDDVWDPMKLEWQFALLRMHPGAIAACSNYQTFSTKHAPQQMDSAWSERLWDFRYRGPHPHHYFLTGNRFHGSASAVLMQAHVAKQCRWDTTMTIGEDWDFWLQACRFGSFVYTYRPLVHLRSHPQSSPKSFEELEAADLIWHLKWRTLIDANPTARVFWTLRTLNFLGALQRGEEKAHSVWDNFEKSQLELLITIFKQRLSLRVLVREIVHYTRHAVMSYLDGVIRLVLKHQKVGEMLRTFSDQRIPDLSDLSRGQVVELPESDGDQSHGALK